MMLNLYTILLIGVTLAVILSRRTMYAILFLILLFALIAIFVYSLDIDFIGLIFVIVYVGAIATLFLFIVMMLGGEDWETQLSVDLDTSNLLNSSGFISSRLFSLINKLNWDLKYVLLDTLIVFSFGLCLMNVFSGKLMNNLPAWFSHVQSTYNTNMFDTSFLYGVFFYDYWYLPFLLAGVVLFIAMLGSIVLTTRLLALPPVENKKDESKEKKVTTTSKKQHKFNTTQEDYDKLLEEQLAKRKLEREMPLMWLLPQLLWSAFCIIVGYYFSGVFIIGDNTRILYIVTVAGIYLWVSYKFLDWTVAKILNKPNK